MRYQSREFHKFFWAINCCSCNTYGFHEIFAFRIFAKFSHFAKFRFVFASFIFAKKAKFREKVCEMRTKIFAFFLRNVSFAGNPRYDTNLQEAYRGCWIRRLQLLTLIIQDKTRTYKKQIEDAELGDCNF